VVAGILLLGLPACLPPGNPVGHRGGGDDGGAGDPAEEAGHGVSCLLGVQRGYAVEDVLTGPLLVAGFAISLGLSAI
jgi:hypothetical protein